MSWAEEKKRLIELGEKFDEADKVNTVVCSGGCGRRKPICTDYGGELHAFVCDQCALLRPTPNERPRPISEMAEQRAVFGGECPPLDPYGKNPHEVGSKLDAGKIRAGLMASGFARALEKVAEITTYGANKYTPNGWLSVPDAENRYKDALYRHLLRAEQGEEFDPESNLPHLAHAAWNALALLELQERGHQDWRKELKENSTTGVLGGDPPSSRQHFGQHKPGTCVLCDRPPKHGGRDGDDL